MESSSTESAWRCSVDIRISHPQLDPAETSKTLNAVPLIAQRPGESRVPHGACKSAGYWCIEHRIEYPQRPDSLFSWAEQFVLEREAYFRRMVENGCDVNVYIGIHTNVLAMGFTIPATPTIWKLGISVGIEFFSR